MQVFNSIESNKKCGPLWNNITSVIIYSHIDWKLFKRYCHGFRSLLFLKFEKSITIFFIID